jgi:hypothetical protein
MEPYAECGSDYKNKIAVRQWEKLALPENDEFELRVARFGAPPPLSQLVYE